MGHLVYRGKSNSPPVLTDDTGETGAVSLLYDREGNRRYLTVSDRAAFLRAAREMPTSAPSAWCSLTVARAGNLTAAQMALEEALRSNPGDRNFRQVLATVYASLGKFTEANRTLKTSDSGRSMLKKRGAASTRTRDLGIAAYFDLMQADRGRPSDLG